MAQIEINKNHRLSKKWMVGGLLAAILLVASSIFLLLYPFASKVKKDYYHGANPILFNGTQKGNALIAEKTVFVPLDFLQKNIDSGIVYDEQSKSVIITTSDKVVQMPDDSLTYFVNRQPVSLRLSPILSKNGKIYIALDPILSYYAISYKQLSGSHAIWIQKDGESYAKGQLTSMNINPEKIRLREAPSWQSPYTADMKPKEVVMIEGEKGDFYLVRKENGISGYIKQSYVHKGQTVNIKVARQPKKFQFPKIQGPIQLTWEAVYTKNPNPALIPDMPGVNVISPTWFSLAGADGTVNNLASLDYSKWAQSKGYQVWGLFSNSFKPSLTHDALKDFATRQKIILQLLHFSQMYQLQGINFDIENVKAADGPLVTQFIREAAPYLHEAGLSVSMDISFSAGEYNNWSSFYERSELGKAVDYLIVMAYDEHWGAASGAGSVASLPWVEKNLQYLLKEVPGNKLILGVPLYARLWKEQSKPDGTKALSSQALTMDKVKAWIAEKGITPSYDAASDQNYAEYYDSNEKATYKIWIEDESSLKKRKDLAVSYHLAGIGTWARYFANSTAWSALNMNADKTLTKK